MQRMETKEMSDWELAKQLLAGKDHICSNCVEFFDEYCHQPGWGVMTPIDNGATCYNWMKRAD